MGITRKSGGAEYELETLLGNTARPRGASGLFPGREGLPGGEDRGPGLLDTHHTYNAKGQLIRVSRGARFVRYAYDGRGLLQSKSDALGRTTRYLHDSKGRLAAIVRPDGGMLAFAYDAEGRLAALSTPMGASHGLDTDAADLDTGTDAPLSGSCRQLYDARGRVVKVELPSGKSISYIYENDRLARVLLPEGVVKLSWGPEGLARVSMGRESVNWEYGQGLPVAEMRYGTLERELAFSYENGRLASFSYSGATRRFAYDRDGRLVRAGNFSIGRDPESGLALALGDGTVQIGRQYNENGELDAQEWSVGGRPASSWALARDEAGRIVRKGEAAGGRGLRYEYAYDAAGRLARVLRDGAPVEEYRYNADGARVYEVNRLRGIAGRAYEYDGEGRLVSAGDERFAYDRDGFLIRKAGRAGVTGYTYASRGGLLRVDLPGGSVVEYVNDPFGRRIAKKVDGKVVEKYLWQGMTRLLAVTDGWNSLLCRFAYADARVPLAMEWGGRTYYLSYDQVGSLRQVTDSAGRAVKVLEYDSFGNVIRDSAPGFFLPIGFAGGLVDRHTGLVRFGYRDYDPGIGRWTAKDPLGFAGGDVDLFGYVGNDPVNGIDPYGLVDLFLGVEGDLVGILGLEGGAGIVIDTDNFGDSGFYGNIGPAVGANVGIGFGGGIAKETEGWSYNFDANVGTFSPTISGDINGFNGAGISIGPGGGASASATYSGTYTLNNMYRDIKNFIDKKIIRKDTFF